MIGSEPADGTLSDEQIVELLHREGIDIAHRTVAKYRTAMRIPSSPQRRSLKRRGRVGEGKQLRPRLST
jgi:RNA polymerase sigma-54 factor